jgi:hypothetical protein
MLGPDVPFNPMWRRAARNVSIPLLGGIPTRRGPRVPVFAAYPYALDPPYREMLRRVERRANVEFVFPEDDSSPTHLDQKILTLIENVEFAIFDWSDWNANVAFEFGLAIGTIGARPMLGAADRWSRLAIVVRAGSDREVPSDLGGMGRNRYADLEDLENQLARILARFGPPTGLREAPP